MNEREALVRNTFWHGLVTIIGLLASMGASVALARGLGPARMGDYAYIAWASRSLTALTMLGFAVATIRFTARSLAQADRPLARGVLELMTRWQVIAATIVAAVTVPIVLVAAPPSIRWPLVVVCLGLVPVTLEQVYAHGVFGAQRYDLAAQAITLKLVLHLVAALLVLVAGIDLLEFVVGTTLGTIVAGWIQRRRVQQLYAGTSVPVPATTKREVATFVLPLSFVVVLDALVWERFEVFFLWLWGTPYDVAFFSLAIGLAVKAMVLPEIAVGALLPAFSALHGRGATGEFGRVYGRAIRYVALAAVPIAAVGAGLAPEIVTFLFGKAYLPVAPLLPVLLVGAVIAAIRRVAWSALRGLGDQWSAARATTVAAIVDIVTLTLLIGPYGVWAAVAANVAAQCVATAWVLGVMARTHDHHLPLGELVRIVIAGGLALAATLALGSPDHLGLVRAVLAGVAGLVTFAAACVAMRVVGMDEWRLLVAWSSGRLAAPPA